MSLTKQTTNHYNLKRAARFKAAGINDADVAYATPEFLGVGNPTFSCSLCDHPNCVYNFRLHFEAPDLIDALAGVAKGITRTTEVTFDQVGSTCITNWLDALPETAEKLAALVKWHAALKAMNKVKAAKVVVSLCANAGYDSPEDAYDAYMALDLHSYASPARKALTLKERKQLRRNRHGVKNCTSSAGTVKAWLANLATAKAASNVAPDVAITSLVTKLAPQIAAPKKAKDDLAKLTASDRDLIERARKGWKAGKANLNDWERNAFTDIGTKVVKFGSFAPGGKQRALYVKLLALLEKVAAPVATVATPAPAKPAVFVSPSGIDGARY